MWINGRNPADDGWSVMTISGWMIGATSDRPVAGMPGVAAVMPALSATVSPRTLSMTLEPTAALTAITDRDAAVLTLKDRLRGLVWLRFDDAPTRVVRAVCTAFSVESAESFTVFTVPTVRVVISLTAYDPISYDTEPRVIALASTPTEVPLGDMASTPVIRWGGSWSSSTSRTLILRDAGGVARHTMTVTTSSTGSLASTDHLEIDVARRYLTKVEDDGTRTNVADWYASSTWPVFDPAFQDRSNSRFATVEISAGTAQLTYRRAYGL